VVPNVKKLITNFREINSNLQINNLTIKDEIIVDTKIQDTRTETEDQYKKGKKDKKKKIIIDGGFF